MSYNLSEISSYITDKVLVSDLQEYQYISTDNMVVNRGGIVATKCFPTVSKVASFKKGDILISNIRPYFKKIWHATFDGGCSNDVLIIRAKEETDDKFLYYVLSSDDFFDYATATSKDGTKMPRGDKVAIMKYQVPDLVLEQQQKIAKILSALDEKIELNNKINENLHAQAQAIFKSWFVDFEPFDGTVPSDWEKGTLSDYIDIRRGGSPRPIKDFIVEKGINWLKIADVTSVTSPFVFETKEFIKEEGIKKSVLLNEDSLVLSNSATPGIPKILALSCCIHDGWLYFPNSKFSNEFLFLFFENIREKLILLGNGSVFTNLKTEILKSFPCILPKTNILEKFDKLVSPLFYVIKLKDLENQKLAQIRDTLLPKLMSGELEV